MANAVEDEFGTGRFATFWTSEQEDEAAFLEAFGEHLEDWMLRWAQSRWGHLEASPRIPLHATFLSFLSIGVFVGLALYIGRRK